MIGGSVENVSLNILLQLLNGLKDDLVKISLEGIDWDLAISNAKKSGLIVQKNNEKYDARTICHMPCL